MIWVFYLIQAYKRHHAWYCQLQRETESCWKHNRSFMKHWITSGLCKIDQNMAAMSINVHFLSLHITIHCMITKCSMLLTSCHLHFIFAILNELCSVLYIYSFVNRLIFHVLGFIFVSFHLKIISKKIWHPNLYGASKRQTHIYRPLVCKYKTSQHRLFSAGV